jgi:hypothetical protein
MTPFAIIDEVKYDYAEWIEHSCDPEHLVSFILAQKISKLMSHVEYLERRINNVSR